MNREDMHFYSNQKRNLNYIFLVFNFVATFQDFFTSTPLKKPILYGPKLINVLSQILMSFKQAISIILQNDNKPSFPTTTTTFIDDHERFSVDP